MNQARIIALYLQDRTAEAIVLEAATYLWGLILIGAITMGIAALTLWLAFVTGYWTVTQLM